MGKTRGRLERERCHTEKRETRVKKKRAKGKVMYDRESEIEREREIREMTITEHGVLNLGFFSTTLASTFAGRGTRRRLEEEEKIQENGGTRCK